MKLVALDSIAMPDGYTYVVVTDGERFAAISGYRETDTDYEPMWHDTQASACVAADQARRQNGDL